MSLNCSYLLRNEVDDLCYFVYRKRKHGYWYVLVLKRNALLFGEKREKRKQEQYELLFIYRHRNWVVNQWSSDWAVLSCVSHKLGHKVTAWCEECYSPYRIFFYILVYAQQNHLFSFFFQNRFKLPGGISVVVHTVHATSRRFCVSFSGGGLQRQIKMYNTLLFINVI